MRYALLSDVHGNLPALEAVPRVEVERVDYDVDAAARGVDAAGLPEEFAEFLRAGGGPAGAPAA